MTDTPRHEPLSPDPTIAQNPTVAQGSAEESGYSTGATSTAAVPAASASTTTSTTTTSSTSTGGSGGQSSTAEAAKGRAGEVKDSAKEAAAGVAGTAKEQAGQVAGEAKDRARDLLGQGRSEVSEQARSQQQRAAGGLHALSRQLHEMSANASEPGLAQDLTGQVAGQAGALASWLEDREPGDLLEEVRRYARRRPGTFLALCAGAGVLVGRLGRGLQADATSDTTSGSGTTSSGTGGFTSNGTTTARPTTLA